MTTRNDILVSIKTMLESIKRVNGFDNDVVQVERKFLFWDQVVNTPLLMVAGGREVFEDELGDHTVSYMDVSIRGYTKNKSTPEEALNSLIGDVLKMVENSAYDTYKLRIRPISIETDEGLLHLESEGMALFELKLSVNFRFLRSSP